MITIKKDKENHYYCDFCYSRIERGIKDCPICNCHLLNEQYPDDNDLYIINLLDIDENSKPIYVTHDFEKEIKNIETRIKLLTDTNRNRDKKAFLTFLLSLFIRSIAYTYPKKAKYKKVFLKDHPLTFFDDVDYRSFNIYDVNNLEHKVLELISDENKNNLDIFFKSIYQQLNEAKSYYLSKINASKINDTNDYGNIFISHKTSSIDNNKIEAKASLVAKKIYEEFYKNGFNPFFDKFDIETGDIWEQKLFIALMNTKCLILVIENERELLNEYASWVYLEWQLINKKRRKDKRIRIFPFFKRGINIPLEIRDDLSDIDFGDGFLLETLDKDVSNLINVILSQASKNIDRLEIYKTSKKSTTFNYGFVKANNDEVNKNIDSKTKKLIIDQACIDPKEAKKLLLSFDIDKDDNLYLEWCFIIDNVFYNYQKYKIKDEYGLDNIRLNNEGHIDENYYQQMILIIKNGLMVLDIDIFLNKILFLIDNLINNNKHSLALYLINLFLIDDFDNFDDKKKSLFLSILEKALLKGLDDLDINEIINLFTKYVSYYEKYYSKKIDVNIAFKVIMKLIDNNMMIEAEFYSENNISSNEMILKNQLPISLDNPINLNPDKITYKNDYFLKYCPNDISYRQFIASIILIKEGNLNSLSFFQKEVIDNPYLYFISIYFDLINRIIDLINFRNDPISVNNNRQTFEWDKASYIQILHEQSLDYEKYNYFFIFASLFKKIDDCHQVLYKIFINDYLATDIFDINVCSFLDNVDKELYIQIKNIIEAINKQNKLIIFTIDNINKYIDSIVNNNNKSKETPPTFLIIIKQIYLLLPYLNNVNIKNQIFIWIKVLKKIYVDDYDIDAHYDVTSPLYDFLYYLIKNSNQYFDKTENDFLNSFIDELVKIKEDEKKVYNQINKDNYSLSILNVVTTSIFGVGSLTFGIIFMITASDKGSNILFPIFNFAEMFNNLSSFFYCFFAIFVLLVGLFSSFISIYQSVKYHNDKKLQRFDENDIASLIGFAAIFILQIISIPYYLYGKTYLFESVQNYLLSTIIISSFILVLNILSTIFNSIKRK